MKTKVCSKCKIEKPIEAFSKHKGYKGNRRTECTECKNSNNLKRYHETKHLNPYNYEEDKDRKLRSTYGISYAEYLSMLDAQGGCCAICGSSGNGNRRAFAVDHCHSCGEIRGLLCSRCNTALGSLKEDIGVMMRAIEYIKFHKGVDQ